MTLLYQFGIIKISQFGIILHSEEFMYLLIVAIVIVAIIVLVIVCKKAAKKRHSTCSKCKTQLTYPNDYTFAVSSLRWKKGTKKETKGDFEYETTYRIYYRILYVYSVCPKCHAEKSFTREIEIWRSDSDYSLSESQEISIIQDRIYKLFDKNVFGTTQSRDIEFKVLDD